MNRPIFPCIAAVRDPSLTATIRRRTSLRYGAGPNPALDRPAHVRAGSGLAWFNDRLAVVQDDASFVALIDPARESVDALPLPAGKGGLRQFDDLRGNKGDKPDWEACTTIPTADGESLWMFGSGSTEQREAIAIVQQSGAVEVFQADELYRALRSEKTFSGSELNVEGAMFLAGRIRLLNRGNGAKRGILQPVNASCDIHCGDLEAYLRQPGRQPAPALLGIVQYDLGLLTGARLTFTDAVATEAGFLYLAAAEDSADAVTDGPVAGSAIGTVNAEGSCRWTELREADGQLSRAKAEGLCVAPGCNNRLYLVVDADDPPRPSELCEVDLTGPW